MLDNGLVGSLELASESHVEIWIYTDPNSAFFINQESEANMAAPDEASYALFTCPGESTLLMTCWLASNKSPEPVRSPSAD